MVSNIIFLIGILFLISFIIYEVFNGFLLAYSNLSIKDDMTLIYITILTKDIDKEVSLQYIRHRQLYYEKLENNNITNKKIILGLLLLVIGYSNIVTLVIMFYIFV